MYLTIVKIIYKKTKQEEGLSKLIIKYLNTILANIKKNSVSLSEFKKINFKKVRELSDLEYQEYLNRVNKIMKEKGFRPPAPINHSILKIIVVSKKGNNIVKYETDWVYSKF